MIVVYNLYKILLIYTNVSFDFLAFKINRATKIVAKYGYLDAFVYFWPGDCISDQFPTATSRS